MALVLSCALAFGIGANDSANIWGTSVSNGAISLRLATAIGGIMEVLGALTMGYGVSHMLGQDILKVEDPDCWACGYCNSRMGAYGIIMVSALGAAVVYTMLTTLIAMSYSTVQSVVGGIVGASWLVVGGSCLNWHVGNGISALFLSWLLSPVLAGLISACVYCSLTWAVVYSRSPVRRATQYVSLCTFVTTLVTGLSACVLHQTVLSPLPVSIKLMLVLAVSTIAWIIMSVGVKGRAQSLPAELSYWGEYGSSNKTGHVSLSQPNTPGLGHDSSGSDSAAATGAGPVLADLQSPNAGSGFGRDAAPTAGTGSGFDCDAATPSAWSDGGSTDRGSVRSDGASNARSGGGRLGGGGGGGGVSGGGMRSGPASARGSAGDLPGVAEGDGDASDTASLAPRMYNPNEHIPTPPRRLASLMDGGVAGPVPTHAPPTMLRAFSTARTSTGTGTHGSEEEAWPSGASPTQSPSPYLLGLDRWSGSRQQWSEPPSLHGVTEEEADDDDDDDDDGEAGRSELMPVSNEHAIQLAQLYLRHVGEQASGIRDRRVGSRARRQARPLLRRNKMPPGLLDRAIQDQWSAITRAEQEDDPVEVLQYHYIPEESRIMMMERPEVLNGAQRDAVGMFRYLLVYQAALEAFAHGANDTANGAGPLVSVYNVMASGLYECNTERQYVWIMATVGLFVALGTVTLGYRVIKTIGTDLAQINYMRGFAIEFGTTITVLIFTVLRVPISTTHCQVAAVVFVAALSGHGHVSWNLLARMLTSSLITLPFSALLAALFCWLLLFAV